ncbi:hypothetical protein Tco_0827760 [Tanacetum coccineum]
MRVLLLHLIFTLSGELRTSTRVPAYLDNQNTTLLLTFDLTVHDLDRFFDEVELVVDLNLIQRKGECFVRLTLLQILKRVDEIVRFKLIFITKALTLRGLARSFLLRAYAAMLAFPG